MKKWILSTLACVVVSVESFACAWFEPDFEYYNLFMQEIIEEPEYFPFLFTQSCRFYKGEAKMKNENIEEWEKYLGISYEDAHYLVFESKENDLRDLAKGKSSADPKLGFITPDFVRKHKQSLLYLAYAKYLEPYMYIAHSVVDTWGYSSEPIHRADELDYAKVISVLERSWKAETDKELKLRYGYQLVRFAHYSLMYDESVRYFNEYVEVLNYKPAMYYHALAQKAGALRGLGDVKAANMDFFNVFVHSRDLKTMAVTSIEFTDNVDFHDFLESAKTEKERNDAYLLLGYNNYNNPLNEAEKIVKTSPNAVQAKVLISRSINQIEREAMPIGYYSPIEVDLNAPMEDKRYPVFAPAIHAFCDDVLSLVKRMAESPQVNDKNYWYLTTSYLCFLKKDFVQAKEWLAKVEEASELYVKQKQSLAMYIDICEHPRITPELEVKFFTQYGEFFQYKAGSEYPDYFNPMYTSQSFMVDALANRYYLQKDLAKSFIMNNPVSVLQSYPNMDLINEIEQFYLKKDKNAWEKFWENKANDLNDINIQSFLYGLKGVVFLTSGEFDKANKMFRKTLEKGKVSGLVFGYNRIECFGCSESMTMSVDYLDEYDFISMNMDMEELTEALIRLEKIGRGKKDDAARANYLLGNFYYNVSNTGYYRNLLRFSDTNGYNYARYDWKEKPHSSREIYFKNYPTFYENTVDLSQKYLEKAYSQAVFPELKARIVFALSKCEQENYYQANNISYNRWFNEGDGILISDRTSFKELMNYQQTDFFKEVQSNCKYFDYYVNYCSK